MRRALVPIDLGGSPVACLLRPPLRPPTSLDTARALVAQTRRDRLRPGDALEVGLFHGGLPDDALLAALSGLPLRLSCSPADLSPPAARRLLAQGVGTIELEVLSFAPSALRRLERGYTAHRAAAMLRALVRLGFRVGVVLAPGLPWATEQDDLDDARRLHAPRPDLDHGLLPAHFVRVLPALVWAGSRLAAEVEEGQWAPVSLPETIERVARMADALEANGVEIARIGWQPAADLGVAVVAGPVHPDLRGRVEVLRFRGRLATALAGVPRGSLAALSVNPKDLGWAKGRSDENLRLLRARLGLAGLQVRGDPAVARGQVRLRAPVLPR